MTKNKIFYSLSKYEISAIKKLLINTQKRNYLNILISFSQDDINKLYKLLSSLYTINNKEQVENAIWETFICNKIIQELDAKELIYYQHDIVQETSVLKSYNLDMFIKNMNNRSNIERLSQIIKNQISKKVIVHYFQENTIIPIGLQKIINSILVSKLPFTNFLYTTRNSLNSYYMQDGYWIKQENSNVEMWKLIPNIE